MKTETEFKEIYMGYTIIQDWSTNPYRTTPEFKYFPTHQGEQDDASCEDGESFSYCGNARWADSLEEAKDYIHDLNPQTNDWKTEEDWAREEQQMNDNDAAEDKIVNL